MPGHHQCRDGQLRAWRGPGDAALARSRVHEHPRLVDRLGGAGHVGFVRLLSRGVSQSRLGRERVPTGGARCPAPRRGGLRGSRDEEGRARRDAVDDRGIDGGRRDRLFLRPRIRARHLGRPRRARPGVRAGGRLWRHLRDPLPKPRRGHDRFGGGGGAYRRAFGHAPADVPFHPPALGAGGPGEAGHGGVGGRARGAG